MLKKFIIFILLITNIKVYASESNIELKKLDWSFNGLNGKFDVESIKRGFEVYKQVCSSCHAISGIAYRNLIDIGFTESDSKKIAAEATILDGPNDEGEMFERPAILADKFVSPFKNEKAARSANNGAYPLDLTLIIKARADGPNYVYSLLTGFDEDKPENFEVPEGMYYNKYFPGHLLAMAPPLTEGGISYSDGTNATIHQMAKDIVHFLQWTAEPEMEDRKRIGINVLIYLGIMTIFFYFIYRKIWNTLD